MWAEKQFGNLDEFWKLSIQREKFIAEDKIKEEKLFESIDIFIFVQHFVNPDIKLTEEQVIQHIDWMINKNEIPKNLRNKACDYGRRSLFKAIYPRIKGGQAGSLDAPNP